MTDPYRIGAQDFARVAVSMGHREWGRCESCHRYRRCRWGGMTLMMLCKRCHPTELAKFYRENPWATLRRANS